ncbi:MAG TPA: DNA mismatch endonuclease Vsr [Bacteroidales bacterium]|nr:DNA mismatch endonuclease Vsr [Candidatus Cloacimonas acidaminovorans]HOR10334.1 DNA mismatch endonuclease Vsr [Bacteroidales bacterium]HOT18093.1 DNA mismatch endonuclease Vsr [Bacteroidales bacterium]HPA69464.1 DNA mismatch endonuclease Vsr [Bacteroidales bacterium]HPK85122.1 DNA mismatch endonuclease Vsr [Bacteroidales bacterium]
MDVLTKEQRSKNMKAIRSKNTKMELLLAKALWAQGVRYRKNDKAIFGCPDLTIRKHKLAIFVDSEFFHGKDWDREKYRIKTNREFWWKKIETNQKRDQTVNEFLVNNGWKVLRFWSRDVHKKLNLCIYKINAVINEQNMVKYSEIRKKLNININKPELNELAHLTHFLQSYQNGSSSFFEKEALRYLHAVQFNADPLDEPYFQARLPIEWDIPFPPVEHPKFTFIDLFAGIGGFRLAFQELGGKCVFSSEYNYFAQKTYEANFGEVPFGDITKIDEKEIPDHDILIAGFPCQPFSIAGVTKKNALGRNHGFKDETQGTLFFDIARIIEEKKPKTFFLENVKNLVSHDSGRTFMVISNTLKELNYTIYPKVLDGKHFVPQHRERIVIIGFSNDFFKGKEKFEFPDMPIADHRIVDILEKKADPKYTLSDNLWEYLIRYAEKHKAKGNGFGYGMTDLNGISRTLSARYYKDGAEILIPQKNKNPRRLTPRECARLQGYPDTFVIPVSDNQAYRQFGNSVVVPLMKYVGRQLVSELLRHDKQYSPIRHTDSPRV